jgi:6-phosphogluconate dehydrogenase
MIGLGVMGRNLALNMADHGFRVAVYNRDVEVTREFVAGHPATPGGLAACDTLRDLVRGLCRPRRIVAMIQSGAPVDEIVSALRPLVDRGDVIVDGGNSRWTDTIRREHDLAGRGIHFVGSGVSGGETGARFGPSLMPGGSAEGWRAIRPVWRAIAARVDRRTGRPIAGAAPGRPVRGGEPCAAYIGRDGAGHYVKMVHNGIEYADMQLIAEAYFLLQRLLGLAPDALADVFAGWNEGDLDSYLIEITSDILRQRDPERPRRFLVDAVLDAAGQKGTGQWTAIDALETGVATPTIAEAVFARIVSAAKDERVAASKRLSGSRFVHRGSSRATIDAVRDALYASKVCVYAQGFALLARAREEHGWRLDLADIARIWRGGCIIRARLLHRIAEAYARDRRLPNLLLDRHVRRKLAAALPGWRATVSYAARAGVAAPAFMSALAYYDSYRSARLPANLLQAQRDYFGAHTYERTDRPRGRRFHLQWSDPRRRQIRA